MGRSDADLLEMLEMNVHRALANGLRALDHEDLVQYAMTLEMGYDAGAHESVNVRGEAYALGYDAGYNQGHYDGSWLGRLLRWCRSCRNCRRG